MSNGWKKATTKPKGHAWVRIAILFLLVGAGAALLWYNGYFAVGPVSPGAEQTVSPNAAVTPMPTTISQRSIREIAYDKDMASLATLCENEGVDAQTREDAAKQLQKMVEGHQTELAIDEALSAAGFSPCLTLLQNGALTVMVEAEELTGTQSATILSLCAAHADIGVENIRIMTGEK